jgi:sulfopyruvate decarboxylase subunit alpha
MKEATPYMQAVVDGLCSAGVATFTHVPSSHAAPVIRGLEARGVRSVLANREDEAIGIAGGLRLVNVRSAVVMQDNGFGNALTALTTFALAYHVGLPIIANERGGVGEYNSMIHAISDPVPGILRASGIRVERVSAADSPEYWRSSIEATATLAFMQRRPIVALFPALHPALGVQT